MTAASSAKTAHRWRLDHLFDNEALWRGDETKLEELQEAFNNAGNRAARDRAEANLLRYARMYSFSAPVTGGKKFFEITTSRGVEKRAYQGRGNEALELAKSLMLFYHKRLDIQEDVEDFLTTHGAPLKTMAVTMQLGGTLAAGIVNTFAMYTHLAPYLAQTNPKFGRGGGFGDARVVGAISKAISQFANAKFGDRKFLEEVWNNGTWAEHGMSKREAGFLLDQTIRGELKASQMQALLGTTRSKITGRLANKAIELWMSVFSYTEALNRRVSAMVAYRLYSERAIDAGFSEDDLLDYNSDLYNEIAEEARRTVRHTQGNYALWNRPAVMRGNVLTHVLMYKMFVVNTLEMIGQLPTRQQVQMLALLVLMAGLKGLPFADDLMDLIDIIAQKLGIRMGSIEAELTRGIDQILPGASPLVMRGIIDSASGGTFSTRLGLGDIIPFTGMMREGADIGRELEGGFGPIYSAAKGAFDYAGFVADLGLQTVGLKDQTSDPADLIRRNPFAGVRTLESILYAQDGQITDRQGRVVSNDVNAQIVAARALGFYPSAATQANDIVRLSRYVDDYAKRIRSTYVTAWANARRANNTQRMRRIEQDVREWNRRAEAAGDDEFVITNFRDAAQRSYEERNRETTERYGRTTTAPTVDELARAYGLDSGD